MLKYVTVAETHMETGPKWAPDASGFDAFYGATWQRTCAEVQILFGYQIDVGDSVQDAYVRAWERWPTISGYEKPEAWVRLVAYRCAIGRWRRAMFALHRTTTAVSDWTPEPTPNHVALAQSLRRLPCHEREALVFHYLCELTVDEIGRQLRVPVGTVKARLSRGRSHLAQLMAEEA